MAKQKDEALTLKTMDLVKKVDVEHVKTFNQVDVATRKQIVEVAENYSEQLLEQTRSKLEAILPKQFQAVVKEVMDLNEKKNSLEVKLRVQEARKNETENAMKNRLERAKLNKELDETIYNLLIKYEEAQALTVIPQEVTVLRSNLIDIRNGFLDDADNTINILQAQIEALKEVKKIFAIETTGIYGKALKSVIGGEINVTDFNNAANTGTPVIDYLIKL